MTIGPIRLPYCNLVWGPSAAAHAAEDGDIIVIVDTLSFSTATAVAVACGGDVYPCGTYEEAEGIARVVGGQVAVARGDVPSQGRYSLSPLTLLDLEPGSWIVLRSVNGGICTKAAASGAAVFAGALVNAGAVASAVNALLRQEPERRVSVVASGERDSASRDMPIRFAVEDSLGAGAIIVGVDCYKSPSARAAEAALDQMRGHLEWALSESVSGQELIEQGFADDVRFAAQLDTYRVVPVLHGDHFDLLKESHGEGSATGQTDEREISK